MLKKFFNFWFLLFGLVGLLVISAGDLSWAAAGELRAVVRVSKANVRKAPDKYSPRLFSLRRNSKVKVLKECDQWFYIANAKGRRGWVFKSLVKIIKPPKIEPEIEFFGDNLEPEQEVFFSTVISRLRKQLAVVEPLHFDFVVSHVVSGLDSDSNLATEPLISWLLLLRIPFSRALYQQKKGKDLEVGTVDLLLYQGYLKVMLESRDLMVAEIKKNPQLWPALGSGPGAVKVMLVLKSENGDEVALGGFRGHGFPVFNDYMILEIHGFSQFSLRSSMSVSVADFNKFVLPPPQLPDGSRAPASLAHDFFGFVY